MVIAKDLLLMRGLPGSGKSYRENYLLECFLDYSSAIKCSADDFFINKHTGEYEFKQNLAGIAHGVCQAKVKKAMLGGTNWIIVDNTNINYQHCEPYLLLSKEHDYKVSFQEPDTLWKYDVNECFKRNSHKVPLDTIQKMRDNWDEESVILEKFDNLLRLKELRELNGNSK